MRNRRGQLRNIRYRVLVPLWGDRYISKFCNIALPALLADGNLPTLTRHAECEVVFLTTRESSVDFATHPEIAALEKVCAYSFLFIDDLLSLREYGVILTLAYGRGISSMGARQLSTYFIFLNADFVFSNGLLGTVADRVNRGFNAVVAPSLRANLEDVEGLLRERVDSTSCLSMAPSELVNMAFDHLHPTATASIVNRNNTHSTVANQFFYRIDDDTLIGRFFLMFMLCIRPEQPFTASTGWCDYVLIPELVPSGNYDVLINSNDGFILEMQARSGELELIREGRIMSQEFASRLSIWTTANHRDYASRDVMLLAGKPPDDIEQKRVEFGLFMDDLLDRLTIPPTPFRDHPFWTASLALNARYYSDALPLEMRMPDSPAATGRQRQNTFKSIFEGDISKRPKAEIQAAAFSQALKTSLSKRQTVVSGPATNGAPSFLPASSRNLTLTAQNISAATPLLVSAALGFTAAGAVDADWAFKVSLTWPSLPADSRIYLFVNALNGEVGYTLLAPLYQYGGPISPTGGQFTFDYQSHVGYVGCGLDARPVPIVFLGEVRTGRTRVEETIGYAYNGYHESAFIEGLPSKVSTSHNLGVLPWQTKCILLNAVADAGYVPGQIITEGFGLEDVGRSLPIHATPLTIGTPALDGLRVYDVTTGELVHPDEASWRYKFVAARGW